MRIRAPWLLLSLALLFPACERGLETSGDPTPAAQASPAAQATPEPAPMFRNRGPVVDCRPFEQAPIGSTWFVFDDHNENQTAPDCHHGTSESMLERLLNHPVGETCAVRWTGDVTPVHPFGFAGMGIDLEVEIGRYQQIVLEVRGDGRRYRAQFPMEEQARRAAAGGCNSKDYDFFGTTFRCGDGSTRWEEVTIDLRKIKQEGWGTPWQLRPEHLNVIQVRTLERPVTGFQCDIVVKRLVGPRGG